jgi:hypothetical protein
MTKSSQCEVSRVQFFHQRSLLSLNTVISFPAINLTSMLFGRPGSAGAVHPNAREVCQPCPACTSKQAGNGRAVFCLGSLPQFSS